MTTLLGELELVTGSDLVTDITEKVAGFVAGKGSGLLNVFVPHATAGVAIMETGSGSEQDLASAIERILPGGASYVHRHGSPGHGRDHVLPVFVSPSVVVPVREGRLCLGTWQSIVIVDTNKDNPRRRVILTMLTGEVARHG